MRGPGVSRAWSVVFLAGLSATPMECPLKKSAADQPEAGAAASAVATASAAPKPSASAAAAPSASAAASAAPNVDAKGKPCKQWEAAVDGVCQQICYSDNQCKGGFVCNGEIPGRTDKGKYCGNPVCKAGEKHLRENHYTLKCMVPCKADGDCKGGKKCGATVYFNEDAKSAETHGCE